MKAFFKNPYWTESWPIYATRPGVDGIVSDWRIPGWAYFTICLGLSINALIWPIIGIIEAVQYIF